MHPNWLRARPLPLWLTLGLACLSTACPGLRAQEAASDGSEAPLAISGPTPERNDDPVYAPALRTEHPDRVFWGDTHLHTRLSMDAYTFGTALGPEEAYRFAKGETVMATHGQPTRLEQPLDFLVVADHADGLGAMLALEAGDPTLLANAKLREWREILRSPDRAVRRALEGTQTARDNPKELDAERVRGPAWRALARLADAHYAPGRFTPLVGYEFTGQRGGQNLHRVVIYRDGAERAGDHLPLSPAPSGDPRRLWADLARYERETGGRVLAIPHNGNLSNGILFPLAETEFGDAMDEHYVRARARWEPVYEVTQIKGDGETHPYLSEDDAFADYETWDVGDFAGVPKEKAMLAGEYARSGLRRGLELEARFGTNPYRFGMIGSTDSHTGLATADEDNFFGKHSADMEPSPTRWKDAVGGRGEFVIPGWMMASSGYAAVWARDNTREEIWDALARREVYATTGPRIRVRFFGGWDYAAADAAASDLAAVGYAGGVPMGGVLPARSKGAPRFLVAAAKDARSAHLDRVQIVKGWIDADGRTHERVHDVAWSQPGMRKPGPDRVVPPVPSTVDVERARYTQNHGAAQLAVVWTDPDFDPKAAAFYYVRVLEIPTPRWTTYDQRVLGATLGERVPRVTQERAYSSPIWYQPESG
ncbi:MAG: DUF3604 domain-containing protein [Myxococcota bacterium]